MSLASPFGSLKKQLDSAAIEEAELTYNECRREAKLHLIRKLPLQSTYAAEHLFQILPLSFLHLARL